MEANLCSRRSKLEIDSKTSINHLFILLIFSF